MLRAAGHRVTVATEWDVDASTELMLALHARRSHASMRAFRERHPQRPLLLALTGTDVYRDLRISAEARESLRLADRYIVLQPKAIEELPQGLRSKAQVVYQSCATRLRHAPLKRAFRICVIGHLREEKDPLRAFAALGHIPAHAGIELVQLGDSLDEALARAARGGMRQDRRYRWLGSVAHSRALRWLATSHAMVVSSRMEGGANVISEAIRIGVPVLASRISGNVGLLGEEYPGYFALGDDQALARLMSRAASDRSFYRRLQHRVRLLRPLASPANEARLLRRAIAAAL
jgi:putative glycosyltransferase (TIGR04348 family)